MKETCDCCKRKEIPYVVYELFGQRRLKYCYDCCIAGDATSIPSQLREITRKKLDMARRSAKIK